LYSFLFCKNLKIKIYRTIILYVVLYGCETLSVILREEHRFRVFEKRMMKIFGPKWEEMAAGWRKLHNEELHKLCASSNIISMERNIGILPHYYTVTIQKTMT
jgi:hypothetical protein